MGVLALDGKLNKRNLLACKLCRIALKSFHICVEICAAIKIVDHNESLNNSIDKVVRGAGCVGNNFNVSDICKACACKSTVERISLCLYGGYVAVACIGGLPGKLLGRNDLAVCANVDKSFALNRAVSCVHYYCVNDVALAAIFCEDALKVVILTNKSNLSEAGSAAYHLVCKSDELSVCLVACRYAGVGICGSVYVVIIVAGIVGIVGIIAAAEEGEGKYDKHAGKNCG